MFYSLNIMSYLMTEQLSIINNDIVFHSKCRTKETSLHNDILKPDPEKIYNQCSMICSK